MLVWVEEGVRKKVGSLAARGRSAPTVNDYFLDAMFLGGPARSGQRRVLFTTSQEDIALWPLKSPVLGGTTPTTWPWPAA